MRANVRACALACNEAGTGATLRGDLKGANALAASPHTWKDCCPSITGDCMRVQVFVTRKGVLKL